MHMERNDVQVGVIVEDCGLHIGKVVSVDHKSGNMEILSLFSGTTRGCDLYHCGIEVQTAEEIEHKLAMYEFDGMKAVVDYWRFKEDIFFADLKGKS